jgi:hypothetical protein|tara:strand:- start:11786 stop:12061 length:276 start_codon:yes stop_codon:yes gene_type:complete
MIKGKRFMFLNGGFYYRRIYRRFYRRFYYRRIYRRIYRRSYRRVYWRIYHWRLFYGTKGVGSLSNFCHIFSLIKRFFLKIITPFFVFLSKL